MHGGHIEQASAYVGVLESLESRRLLSNIKTYYASSAGALIAVLHIIGYTTEQIKSTLCGIDPTDSLYDHRGTSWKPSRTSWGQMTRFCAYWGIHSGNQFETIIDNIIFQKTQLRGSTLEDLLIRFDKELRIPVTEVTSGSSVLLTPFSHPHMKACTAVRMALAEPLIMDPVLFNNKYYLNDSLCPFKDYKLPFENTVIATIVNAGHHDCVNDIKCASDLIFATQRTRGHPTLAFRDGSEKDRELIIIKVAPPCHEANYTYYTNMGYQAAEDSYSRRIGKPVRL